MKRLVVGVLLLVVGVALLGGWWWARLSPEQATQLLVSGGLEASRAQDLVVLIGGQAEAEEAKVLVVSGSIEGEEVDIVSEFGGLIVGLHVEEGDQAAAGQVLVRLDEAGLQAQMAEAEAAVKLAEASLATVKAGTHPAEILAARAGLHQAIAERNAARIGWEDLEAILTRPQEIEAQLVEARSAAQLAAIQIEQAEAELASAIVERDQYQAQGSLEEKKLYAIYGYRLEAARAALDAARANEAGAQDMMVALEVLRDNPLALLRQVHSAESQFHIAAAGVEVAAAKLDELEAGAQAEAIALAEAQVVQAEAACAMLQAQIEKLTLVSPVDGVVTSRAAQTGEVAVAGVTLLTVASLDEVALTVYIPVDKLNRVYLGQEVEVLADPFPGRSFMGTVSHISQQAEFTPKNVQTQEERANLVFAVKIRLANLEHLLRPGMFAEAVIRD